MKLIHRRQRERIYVKRWLLGHLLVLVLIFSVSSAACIQYADANPEDGSLNSDKLGSYLISELSLVSETDKLEVVVMCNPPMADYSAIVRSSIVDIQILKTWKAIGGFSCNVTQRQIRSLTELSYVTQIDLDVTERVACMDSARNHTDVDWLQFQYPALDGNADSNTTGYSSDDIVIAVLDTGIGASHYDLDGGKVIGWVDKALDRYYNNHTTPYDDHGHGTHCSSIAAGTGDANSAYRGVAPGCALVGVKMMRHDRTTTLSMAIDSLNWVAEHKSEFGIEVVSCSWGLGPPGEYGTLAQAADTLVSTYGLVVCAAAGNLGTYGSGKILQPGTGRYVITVGNAVDPDESGDDWELSTTSSRGPCTDGRIKPDILAPGTDINAADVFSYDDYTEMTGSSMSTAFVAGLCALWLDYDSILSQRINNQPLVKNLLMASATDMPDDSTPGLDNSFGSGRVDARDQYEYLTADISTSSTDAPLVLNYVYEQPFTRQDEPLWLGDDDDGADWYKFNCDRYYYIWVSADGDPDLVLVVQIYDKNKNLIANSYPGNFMSTGYWAGYTGTYYARIVVYGQTGDYYDITILLTAS